MREVLSESNLDARALKAIEAFHAGIVKEVKSAVANNAIVIVGMAQNPVVKKARKLLEQKNMTFSYLEYGSYFSQWKQRLAIKLWSGWPTFPQVFINGKLAGGCAELEVLLRQGELREFEKP